MTLSLVRSMFVVVSLLALAEGEALAQEAAPEAATDPEWRLDVSAPRAALTYVLRDVAGEHREDLQLEAQLGVRAAHRSGNGFLVRGGLGLGDTDYFGIFDVDYLRRFELVGNGRLGLGLDLAAGVSTVIDASDCVGLFGCVDGPTVDGPRIGGNAEVTLAGHVYGFSVELSAGYRLLAPTERGTSADNVWALEHALSVGGAIGFGFW